MSLQFTNEHFVSQEMDVVSMTFKYNVPPAGLSVLTWKSPNTLRNTLSALTAVADLFVERFVLCQEGDPEEMEIARLFGFVPIATERNLGIQEGLAMCATLPSTETVMVMEGDCLLYDQKNGREIIERCLSLLGEQNLQAIQLQARISEPTPRFWRYWKKGFPLQPTLLGRIRRGAATARTHEAICLPDFPEHGTDYIKPLGNGIFVAESTTVNWCNWSFITTKGFFLETLVKFAREHKTNKKVNGLPDLEHPINCPKNRWWWRNNRFRIGIVQPGIFGHARLERPDDDEKKVL